MRNPVSPDLSIAHRAGPTPRIARLGEAPPAMEPVEMADPGQRTRSSRVMSRRELLVFWTLVSVTVAAIVRYGLWWGSRAPMSPGAGAGDLALFGVRVMLFAALTFVVWHGILMRFGHWFQMAHMRRVEWQPPRPGLRIAFITCFVPGKEPIDMLETTLRAMLETRYPHDTWVLDEGNDPDVIRLCRRLGIHHFSRKGIERYNQPSGPFLARTKAGNHNAWRDAHESRYDAVAQLDVAASEPDQLREPKACLHRQRDERMVSPALPPTEIGCGEQGIDLLGLEERHLCLVGALLGDGQHQGDELGVLGMTQCRVAEQRPHCGQTGVAAAGAVVAIGLEVVQERRDRLDTKVVPDEGGRCRSGAVLHEAEQEGEGAAIGADRGRARLALLGQPLGEEHLHGRGHEGHHRDRFSIRAAASSSSSGAADRYQ